MPKYLLVRTVGELSDKEIEAGSLKSIEAVDQLPGVRWIRSYFSTEEGKLYCEYEAPSVELLFEYAEMAGLPIDSYTVVRDLEPAMFR